MFRQAVVTLVGLIGTASATIPNGFQNAGVAVRVDDNAFRLAALDFLPLLVDQVMQAPIPDVSGEQDGGHYSTSNTHLTEFNVGSIGGTTNPPSNIHLQLQDVSIGIAGNFHIYIKIITDIGSSGNFQVSIPDATISLPASVHRNTATSQIEFQNINPVVTISQVNINYNFDSSVCNLISDIANFFADIKALIADAIAEQIPPQVKTAIEQQIPALLAGLPPLLITEPVATTSYMQLCFSLLAIPPPPPTIGSSRKYGVHYADAAGCEPNPPPVNAYRNVMAWTTESAVDVAVAQRVSLGYLGANMTKLPMSILNTSSVKGLPALTSPECTGCVVAINLSWNKHNPSKFFFFDGDVGQANIKDMHMNFVTFKSENDTHPYGSLLCPFIANFTLNASDIKLSPLPDSSQETLHFELKAKGSASGISVHIPDPTQQSYLGFIEVLLGVLFQQYIPQQLKEGVKLPVESFSHLVLNNPDIAFSNNRMFVGISVDP